MSEKDNVALVRRAYQAFNEADGEHLSRFLADDCVQHMPGEGRFSGDHKGRDAILGMYGEMGALSNGTMQAVPEEFFAYGDHVAVIHREQATRNGRTLDDRMCLLFRLEGGQAVELTDMAENGAADESFWD
jgi:ketosteroid isomerase-like protein